MRVFVPFWIAVAAACAAPVDFQREVRPILSNACFACHGFDSQSRMANLRLDTKQGAFASGVIVPGNPEGSRLYQRIAHQNPARRMPPPSSHKTLTPAQQDTIRRWIAEGAPWKEHWAYVAPSRPPVPAVKNANWVRNPIDAILLARLESAGLAPAPEASRRTLARRLSLDLTGLPPKPADVEAFVKDPAPDAYEKYVDRLLASPQYGEHRARYWLDAARYADTHGIHNDNYREMWPYRDWVIAAFNRNMPFDQFTMEQIAGDLLPNRTIDQQIASGFHRCNVTTAEGGSIDEEVLAMYAKDRVDTTGAVFLGLTIGCATCHDHKFDPITQRDFYSMAAFFRNTTQPAMDGNIAQTPPVIVVPQNASERDAWDRLTAQRKTLDAEPEPFALTPASAINSKPLDGEVDRANFSGDGPFAISMWFDMPASDKGSIRIIAKADKKDRNRGWIFDIDDGVPVIKLIGDRDQQATIRSSVKVKPGTRNHFVIAHDGAADGGGLILWVNGRPGQSGNIYRVVKGSVRNREAVSATHAAASDLRFYNRVLRDDEARLLALWPSAHDEYISTEALYQYSLVHTDNPARRRIIDLAKADAEVREMRRRNPVTHVMQEKADSMPVAHILYRGAYDQPRDLVTPAVPGLLPPLPESYPKNRLGLARWLVQPDHPLLARVTVNRFWQELFGTGIVKTADDFGSQGEAPSHPELLDWLAVEFRESGWDVKKLIRLMVMSNAYRQSAEATPGKLQKDPENRLLSRGPRFRMDAEMVRDYALAASGLLIDHVGGPSVKPYQPEGIWEAVAMDSSDTRFYKRDAGDKLYRRSLYTFWKRSAPPPSMDAFNAPTREACTVRRERTNTPLQALVTMNDIQFVEAARYLAQTSLHAKDPVADIAARVLARPLEPGERAILDRALQTYRMQFTQAPAEAAKLAKAGEKPADPKLEAVEVAAHAMLANLMLNLDEVLSK